MSLFMDVHNIEGGVSADDVAAAHEADLATQGGCQVAAAICSRMWRFGEAVGLSQVTGDRRTAAYALSMLGRVEVLCGYLRAATELLDESVEIAERDHWLAFLPWPQAMLGDVRLADDQVDRAAASLSGVAKSWSG